MSEAPVLVSGFAASELIVSPKRSGLRADVKAIERQITSNYLVSSIARRVDSFGSCVVADIV